MADSVVKIRIDTQEYDAKLKRAGQALTDYFDKVKKGGGTLQHLDEGVLDAVKAFGQMETKATTVKGKLSELTQAFTEMRSRYQQLTEAEKRSPLGVEMSKSLDQLKQRISDTKQGLSGIQQELSGSRFGQFGSIIDGIGQKMGVTGNLTELLTSKTALMTAGMGAAAAAIGKATEKWAEYNAELSRQDQVTQVTTGLQGPAADKMTDQARALVDTYNVDFRDTINAANTLMTQFGKTGDEAMQLIKDGMQGMIQGDGPKLLSMIQQYAPSFRDAGIAADQLVAIIHNSEGGIFTDQNMNAIVMGIKNIRLMTKSTSDALAQLGIDGQKMSRDLSQGTITIFDALRQVAKAIDGVESGSQEAGQVMQQVFGRQGAMAGTKLGEAIATLNTNLEETKRQTGELGQSFSELQQANERLNTAIREAFEYDGWEQMANGIQAKLVTALAAVIDKLGQIRQWFASFTPDGQSQQTRSGINVDRMVSNLGDGQGEKKLKVYQQQLANFDRAINSTKFKIAALGNDAIESGAKSKLQAKLDGMLQARAEYVRRATELHEKGSKSIADAETKPVKPIKPLSTSSTSTGSGKVTPPAIDGSIDAQTQKVQALQKAWRAAATEAQRADIKKQLDEANAVLDQMQGKKVDIAPAGSMAALNKELHDLQTIQQNATNTKDWLDYQKRIEAVTQQMSLLKGELPKGMQAEITVTADTAEALQKVQELGGVLVDSKTFTVTADTAEALQKVQELGGVLVDSKTFTVTADTAEALRKVQELGQPIDVKLVPKMEMATGLSGMSTNIVGQYQQMLQQQLDGTQFDNGSYKDVYANMIDAQTFGNIMREALQNGVDLAATGIDTEGIWDQIIGGDNIDDKVWQDLVDKINEQLKAMNIDPIEIDFKTGSVKHQAKEMSKDWNAAASAIQQVGSAMSQIEDPAAKVMGTIAQAIATMMLSYTQAASQAATMGPWAWIAFAATGLATAISSVTAIKQATSGGFAEGGIVPGNSYSGDLLRTSDYGINSGELILNRAQQGAIASQLQGNGLQNLNLSATISGEQIRLVLNNNGRRTGRGEYVTTNFR